MNTTKTSLTFKKNNKAKFRQPAGYYQQEIPYVHMHRAARLRSDAADAENEQMRHLLAAA